MHWASFRCIGARYSHGLEAIQRWRLEKPSAYLRVIASLIPAELQTSRPLNKLIDAKREAGVSTLRRHLASIGDHKGGRGVAKSRPEHDDNCVLMSRRSTALRSHLLAQRPMDFRIIAHLKLDRALCRESRQWRGSVVLPTAHYIGLAPLSRTHLTS